MTKIVQYILILSTLLMTPFLSVSQTSVMSFNMRYDNPKDAEDSWHKRKEELVKLIESYQPEIVGIQEGLHHQVSYLDSNLTNYNYVGVGRDDGKTKGEFTAIYYNKNRFEVLSNQTYWLSETPNKISVGWDASMERITTFVELLDKKTKSRFYVFNCHFDHLGKIARRESAELLLNLIRDKKIIDKRVIVMGDLNCEPSDIPIKRLTEILEDAYTSSQTSPKGPIGTFNGFDKMNKLNKRIDYILVKNITVNEYSIIDKKRTNNRYISDHFPVFVQLD